MLLVNAFSKENEASPKKESPKSGKELICTSLGESVQYVIVPDEVTVFFKLTESWNDSYRACNLKHHVINWVFYRDIWHWRNKKAIINHKKFKIKIYFEVLCYCGKRLLRKIRAHYHISTFTQIAQIIFGNLICYSCSLMVQSTDAKNTFTL